MSNSSELFLCTTKCSSFKWTDPLFFELSCTQTNTHIYTQTERRKDGNTDRHTDGDEYSIVAVDKPQL